MERDQNYIGIDDVAGMLQVSRTTIEVLLARGKIPRPVRLGRCRRWHREIVTRWMLEQAEKAASETPPEISDRGRGRPRSEGK